MRVLILNHTAHVSGGERSLLDLLRGLPKTVEPVLGAPDGTLAELARASGVRVTPITGTDASLKLSPRTTLVGSLQLGRAAIEAAALARRSSADILHANSIRAGLSAVAAGALSRRPVVAHLRDTLPPGRVSNLTLAAIARGARVVVANSAHTAAAFTAITGRADVEVAYNAIDLDRFDPARYDRAAERARLGLPADALVLIVVAQITPWKGQDEAVRIVHALQEAHPELRLLIVGEAKFVSKSTRYDNLAYLDGIQRRIREAGLEGRVAFLGEREDVPQLLAASDVLLVPSWEEPFGRVVIEGMAMRLPVVATSVGGPAELIADWENGVLAPPRDIEAWARALRALAEDAGLRERLGAAAAERARAFGVHAHGARMAEIYARALGT
jgi:glycosyltransferase involved in cell wall biosynthesis